MGCCGTASRVGTENDFKERNVSPDLETCSLPVSDRQCRDVIFLLLFAAFSGFLAYVLTVSALKGNPERLILGYDDYGNVCGRKNTPIPDARKSGQDTTNEPYLISCFGGISGCHLNKQCVRTCPDGYNVSIFNRCYKRYPHDVLLSQTADVTRDFFVALGSDIINSYKEMIILCAVALGLTSVVLVIFRYFAGVIIWCMLAAISLGLISGTSYLWYRWHVENERQREREILSNGSSKDEVKYWLAGSITATVVTVIFLLIILVMRKRVQLVAVLFKEAGKAIGAMPLLLFQPLLTFCLFAAIVVGWAIGLAYIYSAGDATIDEEDKVSFQLSQFFEGMKWYHLMALFWYTNFIMACQHIIIAGAVSTWFFARDKKDLGSPLSTSLFYLVRFSLGSVAFGSLLVAVLQIIRALLKFLESKLKRYSETCTWVLKCCQCCLWLFQKFIVFLNKNAYIEIAIYGYSFCKAAQEAFRLLSSNILRVAAINSVGDFLIFIAKASITAATVFIGYELLKDKEDLHYIWVPLVLCACFGYFISHCFFSVYQMTIDTLFLCFCEDCERNDGMSRPYYMSKGLMMTIDTLFLCFCEDCERNDGMSRPYYMSKGLMAFVEKSKKSGYSRRETQR